MPPENGAAAVVRGGRRRRLFRNASLVRGRCGKRPLSGGRGAFRSFPTGGMNVRSSYRLSAGVCGCSFSSYGHTIQMYIVERGRNKDKRQ